MPRIRICFLLALLLVLIMLAATAALPQVQILQRTRLGNQTEDITFVSSGQWTDYVALADGYQVGGIKTGVPPRVLFGVQQLGIRVSPRGIAYMPTESLFAIDDGTEVSTLFLADSLGHAQGTRTIQYLNGFLPDFIEGLAYIPRTSPLFPDDLILAANSFTGFSRLEVMLRSGEGVNEIVLDPATFPYVTGVAFHAPNRILVSASNQIWDVDFNGNIVGGPITVDGAGDIEGIVQLSDVDIAAADYVAGKLFFFDHNLNRLPNKDRNYKIGVGVSIPIGVAWNSDTNQHLVSHSAGFPQTPEIVAIPPTLDKATQVVNLAADGYDGSQRLDYLSDRHLIAASVRSTKQIVFFDNGGNQAGQIDVSTIGSPEAIAYIPTAKQFAIKCHESQLVIDIVDEQGNLVRTVDLSSTPLDRIISVTYFQPNPGVERFLILGGSGANLALVTDLQGNVKSSFNYREKLGVITPSDTAAITTGPQKGALSLVDNGDSEMVIFKLQ
jgi:hypothetical protein